MTWLDDLTLTTVIVNTSSGESFKGLKSSVYDDCIVLRETRLVQGEHDVSATIEGEYVIPREKVEGIQILSAGST